MPRSVGIFHNQAGIVAKGVGPEIFVGIGASRETLAEQQMRESVARLLKQINPVLILRGK